MIEQDTLFNLLPAVYRIRDARVAEDDPQSQGIGPLQSLLRVLSQPLSAIADNLEQLYDDAFIETCDEWVVPYIGDLLGTRSLPGSTGAARSTRAEVAHTIRSRRRKGTAAVLETMARDVTGWDSRVVEFFQVISTTQYMNHVRRGNQVTPSLREWEALERIGSAFDTLPRTIAVRSLAKGGRYHVPNLGVFLWKLHARPLRQSTAVPLNDPDRRQYAISPLGCDSQIYTVPAPIEGRTQPQHVPIAISRRVLAEHIDRYYGPDNKSVQLTVNDVRIDAKDIFIANLGDRAAGGWAHLPPAGKYAIDPVLGRIALPPNPAAVTTVQVTFAEAFGADIGGGEYDRAATFDRTDAAAPLMRVPEDYLTIQAAIDALPGGGIVQISGNGRYEEPLHMVAADRAHIELRAASDARPSIVLTRAMEISGGVDARVSINGLLISGNAITVPNSPINQLRDLTIRHCTLVPGLTLTRSGDPADPAQPSLIVDRPDVRVRLDRSICGAMRIDRGSPCVVIDSIVDATDSSNDACLAPGGGSSGPLEIVGSTVIGRVTTRVLTLASNSIFTSRIVVDDRQQGCARFSHIPADSRVPRRHRCVPEIDGGPAVLRFESPRFGSPWYVQLDATTAASIKYGADDNGEMGAYHHVQAPLRESNLRLRLDEYVRAGLEAGVFHER